MFVSCSHFDSKAVCYNLVIYVIDYYKFGPMDIYYHQFCISIVLNHHLANKSAGHDTIMLATDKYSVTLHIASYLT